jgi:hypothetical protein
MTKRIEEAVAHPAQTNAGHAVRPSLVARRGADGRMAVLALQRSVGNRAVGALIGRSRLARRNLAERRLLRWDSFEHRALGDTAAGGPRALITLQCHDRDFPERADPSRWPSAWRMLLGRASAAQIRVATRGLTYGEVVALSGDLYASFIDSSGRARSIFDALDIAPLAEIVRLIPLIYSSSTSTSELQDATGGRYLALAEQNVSHFSNVPVGQRNIDVWRAMHRDAIMLAQQAGADARFSNRAWGTNAAADHFLTDAFSAGHLRTPRAVLLAQGALGNVESKILHDLDNTYGVEVTNRRGDAWTAYGDDKLFSPENAENLRRALVAVNLSKRDISDAIAQGTAYAIPATFAAEQLVPFPVDSSRDRWSGRTPTYVPGLDGEMIRVADDYTQMRDKIIRKEAPGIVAGFFDDDDKVRAWVARTDRAVLGSQPVAEKIRMIEVLLGGFFSWISDDDVVAIEKICGSVPTATEMRQLRTHFEWQIVNRMTDIGQRTRFRVALLRL